MRRAVEQAGKTDIGPQTEYLVYGMPLTTDYDTTGLSFGNTEVCTIGSSSSNQSFNRVDTYDATEDQPNPRDVYDRSSWVLLATLAVFMPVADARRTISMDYAVSVVSCLGVNHGDDHSYTQGSRVPAAAPEPTPVNLGGGGLSGGAIAGIVVGSVVGVGVIVAAAVFIWLRKRKTRRMPEASTPDIIYPKDKPEKPPYVAVDPLSPPEFEDERALREIDSRDAYRSELPDDRALQEIDSREAYKSELPDAASKDPVELAGSTPYVRGEAQ
jgi:hypothetical protein